MKFVKCDKCGLTASIGLVDSDYVCDGENPFLINEKKVADRVYDLCENCYNELTNKKEKIEKDFVKSIGENK